jgi:hypothetical protein
VSEDGSIIEGTRVLVLAGNRGEPGPPVAGTVVSVVKSDYEYWIKLDEKQSFGDHGYWRHDEVIEVLK